MLTFQIRTVTHIDSATRVEKAPFLNSNLISIFSRVRIELADIHCGKKRENPLKDVRYCSEQGNWYWIPISLLRYVKIQRIMFEISRSFFESPHSTISYAMTLTLPTSRPQYKFEIIFPVHSRFFKKDGTLVSEDDCMTKAYLIPEFWQLEVCIQYHTTRSCHVM